MRLSTTLFQSAEHHMRTSSLGSMYRHYKQKSGDHDSAKGSLSTTQCDTRNVGSSVESEMAGASCSTEKVADSACQELQVNDGIKEEWEREQERLKEKLVLEDKDDWAKHQITEDNSPDYPEAEPLRYIGGVDISFVKGHSVNACAAFVVVNFPQLEVVYKDLSMVELTAPYIPGFLAFREADFLVEKFQKLKRNSPQLTPQVIMVDGNGVLHPREFGLACHLGVLLDVPCIGVAKKLFQVDGLEKNQEHQDKIQKLKQGGDTFPLVGDSGKVLGMTLRSCDSTHNPVYVSQGHRISMKTALWVVRKCCLHRVPEPVRQADILSREYIRVEFLKTEVQKKSKGKPKEKKHSNNNHQK